MANIVRRSSLDSDPLKKDFRNFMLKSWMTWFGNPPTDRMYEVGHRLQYGPARDIVMGWRGLSKSFITVDYAGWVLYCDPTEIALTVSGSNDGAKGNAQLLWSMISTWDWLAHMKPGPELRTSALAFDVAGSRREKSPSFRALSLFGQLTGGRGSLIIPDDVETPNTSETEGDRAKLRIRYAELGGSLLKPGGRIKVLGTPQTEQTLYTELAQDKGYGMRIWPVVYPVVSEDKKKDEVSKYGPWLAPTILKEVQENPQLAGTSVEPSRFPEDDLLGRLLEYGQTEYDRQFRLFLDAGAGDAKPLKMRDLIVLEIPDPTEDNPKILLPAELVWAPAQDTEWDDLKVDALNGDSKVYRPAQVGRWVEPEGIIMAIDPSGSGDDETSWSIIAQLHGRAFLLKQEGRLEGFSDPTLEAIAADAKLYGVTKIKIEKNFGQGMFGGLLRPKLQDINYGCTIEDEAAGGVMKEQRIIDTLQPVISGHRLVIAASVLRRDYTIAHQRIEQAKRRNYRLTFQLSRIEKTRGCLAHDDRADSLASGVSSFLGTLRRQVEQAARAAHEDWLKQQAERVLRTRQAQGLPLLDQFGKPIPKSTSEGHTRLGAAWKPRTVGSKGRSLITQLNPEDHKILETRL